MAHGAAASAGSAAGRPEAQAGSEKAQHSGSVAPRSCHHCVAVPSCWRFLWYLYTQQGGSQEIC